MLLLQSRGGWAISRGSKGRGYSEKQKSRCSHIHSGVSTGVSRQTDKIPEASVALCVLAPGLADGIMGVYKHLLLTTVAQPLTTSPF